MGYVFFLSLPMAIMAVLYCVVFEVPPQFLSRQASLLPLPPVIHTGIVVCPKSSEGLEHHVKSISKAVLPSVQS